MIKYLITAIILFCSFTANDLLANMASPYIQGTKIASAFSSRNIKVDKEVLHIKLDSNFNEAHFTVTYTITTEFETATIPLLFYAIDYKSNMAVTLNDSPIDLTPIAQYHNSTLLQQLFPYWSTEDSSIKINWSEEHNEYISINDLIYFDAPINKGTHTIQVKYTADAWLDYTEYWIQKDFRYALSPVKYWNSFGSLDIIIDATASKYPISTNLNLGQLTDSNHNIYRWHFNELPADVLIISPQYKINKIANTIISLDPYFLSLIIGVICIVIHAIVLYRFRKKNHNKRYALPLILGSIFIPAIILSLPILIYSIIEFSLGSIANSRASGYSILLLFFYPIVALIYFLIFWIWDRICKIIFKRKNLNNSPNTHQ